MAIIPKKILVPAHYAASHIKKMFKTIEKTGKLPDDCYGVTEDNKIMFRGDVLFELKATHGFPLDFAIDRIINDEKLAIDWIGFIEAARDNKWWDFQTYEVLCHAMVDAMIDKQMQEEIKLRFQLYVVQYPHSEVK